MADMNLESLKQLFYRALSDMDRPRCVSLALQALESGQAGIVSLYEEVLAPALNGMTDGEIDRPEAIWREHVRSAIIRSVIECCYPYLLKEIERTGVRLDRGKAILLSPVDEYHELGSRMGADFFNLAGYESVFVGANTPKAEVLEGIRREAPDIVVINVVNFYNAFKVKPLVDEIRTAAPGIRILGAGYAFRHDPDLAARVGADGFIRSMEDIRALGEVRV